ncbi:MAG TPA: YetF domain-containing protein [Anaerolineales bacterium]|nr:YetF domain-containing protein [Anaerolineales bacterium]
MDWNELLLTALRATFVYFYLLILVRLLGKREIGASSAFDLLVALMLGDVVDEVIYGEVTLAQGAVAMAIIAVWHLVNAFASYKSEFIDKLTGAPPTVLVKNGRIQRKELARERINETELFSGLRLMDVDDIKEVKQATLEPNGQISVLKEDWAKPLQKQDLSGSKAKA